jgi:hypothetical protein
MVANRRAEYESQGFIVVRGLFTPGEVVELRDHYMAINAEGDRFTEGSYNKQSTDPLCQFPRLMQPHREDVPSLKFLLDDRVRQVLIDVLGDEPFAVQTMVYFKPPGARGQALHQDQRYLRVQPGTCSAAWLALDRCDAANGCMQVVPGSHRLPVLCPTKSDTSRSFTEETVPIPPDMEVVDVVMEPGDVLFFHGNLIHGSEPNQTTDRFRRIVVGHYIVAQAEAVHLWYHPVLKFDGTVADIGEGQEGQRCGTFVERDGRQLIEMTGTVEQALAAH